MIFVLRWLILLSPNKDEQISSFCPDTLHSSDLLSKIGKLVVKAVPNSVKSMLKTLLRHTLIKNIFDFFVDFLIFIHFHYVKILDDTIC
jgi:hypothetical protein